jgi:EmrB/QacA subfamily drug resistance transporter
MQRFRLKRIIGLTQSTNPMSAIPGVLKGGMAKKWWILTAVACGSFMATLDSSIVNIALPTLTVQLSASLTQVKWVVIIYLLTITCFLLPFGRISDQFGRKRIFQTGFWVFTLGSILCSFAPSLSWLVAARMVQGLGAAMLMANGPAIITANFPSNERGGALGTLSMVVSAGLISGPSLGGILITAWGWKSIFLVNVPIGFVGIYLVQYFLKEDLGPLAKPRFDWLGAILQCTLLISIIVLFDPPAISLFGSASHPISRVPLIFFTLGIGAIFVKVESKVPGPLLDLSLLKIRTFWTGNLATLLTFISFSTVTVLMPFFLEQIMAYPTHLAGAYMTSIPLTLLVVAPISGRLSDRLGSRGLSAAGSLVGALTLLTMAGIFGLGLNSGSSHGMIIFTLCAVGLSIGLFQSPNNNAIMGSVPLSKLGVASALLATVRNLGLVVGTGIATGVFTWRMEISHGDFIQSLHFTQSIAGLIFFVAMFVCLGKTL